MVTVAEIAGEVRQKLAARVTDGTIKSGELFENVEGAWNAANAEYDETQPSRGTGYLVVDTVKPIADQFPDHVVGPREMMVFLLDGWTLPPEEAWVLRFDGVDHDVLRFQATLGAGTVGFALVRAHG